MAIPPALKKTLIIGGRVGIPCLLTYATVRLGVWGKASDSLPVANQVAKVFPDLSALANKLPDLGTYHCAFKTAWNRAVRSTTAAIIVIPGSISDTLSKAKKSVFGGTDQTSGKKD